MKPLRLSHPMWVRGLKPSASSDVFLTTKSHPMWVRGLKLAAVAVGETKAQSHPMWVRGLKHMIKN